MSILKYTLDNPTPIADDEFGTDVATNGTYCIVGAPNVDDSNADSGEVYVFNVSDGTLRHTITNPNAYDTSDGDYFGTSVAISDTYFIVGAPYENDADGFERGKAYVFNLSDGTLKYTVDNPETWGGAYDRFAIDVAMTDTYFIVGAYLADDAGNNSGKAYVFNTSDGSLKYTLDNPNAYGESDEDYFGANVAISTNYCIVGAYGEDDTDSLSGKAYVFNLSDGSLRYTLDNPNPHGTSYNDRFSLSLAITDTYCLVGAPNESDAGGNYSGKVYMFNTSDGTLRYTIDNPNALGGSDGDDFGIDVSITDTYCLVGSLDYTGSGRAYVFNTSDGSFKCSMNNPNAYGSSLYDSFSTSVSIAGNYCLAGAPDEDDGGTKSGTAYLFDLSLITDINTETVFTNSNSNNLTPNLRATHTVIVDTILVNNSSNVLSLDITTIKNIYIASSLSNMSANGLAPGLLTTIGIPVLNATQNGANIDLTWSY